MTSTVPQSGLRVLLADDNRDAVDMMAMLLEMHGHEVRIAYSGSDALTVADEFRPHFAFLDIGMPDKDGNEVARLLRAADWTKDLVLVAITGRGHSEDRQRTAHAGFDHHLVKPANVDAILNLFAERRDRARAGS